MLLPVLILSGCITRFCVAEKELNERVGIRPVDDAERPVKAAFKGDGRQRPVTVDVKLRHQKYAACAADIKRGNGTVFFRTQRCPRNVPVNIFFKPLDAFLVMDADGLIDQIGRINDLFMGERMCGRKQNIVAGLYQRQKTKTCLIDFGYVGMLKDVELIKELNPKLNPVVYSGWGDGDGWYMAKDAGAKMVEIGYMAASTMYVPSGFCDLTQPYVGSPTLPLFNAMQVNIDGKRLINEDAFTFDFADLLYNSDDPVGWAIVGQKYMDQYPTHYDEGKDTVFNVHGKDYYMAYKADTVDELAEMTGMDAATLKAAIERYNASCDAGVDEEFGKDPKYMERIDAPYMAMMLTCAVSDAFSGCVINENAQVLDTNGNVIPGFYAAGTCAMPELIGNRYYGCGSIIMTCGVFGRTAGIHAAGMIE